MRKKPNRREAISWIIGMILCPLGVAFSTKGGFGVSMIEAPVYVLHLKMSQIFSFFSFGMSEYLVQGLLIGALFIIMKKFEWRYLLSFATAVLYGFVLDGWLYLLGEGQYASMAMRIISAILGIFLTSLAVSFFFRTTLPLEAWELFVKEIADQFHFNMTKVKWIYDISSLATGIILMLIFFGRFDWTAIGIGTIITTLVNAPIIGFFGKLQDKIYDRIQMARK